MKAAGTLRIQKALLRRMIDHHPDERIRSRAYDMECVLLWVLADRCDWTPETLLLSEVKP